MTEKPDTTEAVANAITTQRVLRRGLSVSPPEAAITAIEAHREALQQAGWTEAPVVKVSVYGTDGLYNLATDPETAPEDYEADAVIFWTIEQLQKRGLPIELEES